MNLMFVYTKEQTKKEGHPLPPSVKGGKMEQCWCPTSCKDAERRQQQVGCERWAAELTSTLQWEVATADLLPMASCHLR